MFWFDGFGRGQFQLAVQFQLAGQKGAKAFVQEDIQGA